jgi:ABC-type branched-subunit amino acid transport system ATPase component
LRVEQLGIEFGGLRALQNIDLNLAYNEILAVIGPNGAGKTTLFNLIAGLYRPTHGKIVFEGDDITSASSHARAEKGISRTFQNLELFGEMTVIDNVKLGGHTRLNCNLFQSLLHTRGEREEEDRLRDEAMSLLDFVGLAAFADQKANSLAFGHQRLLEIARALALRPKLLLLDEPAAGLNSSEIEFLLELLQKIRKELNISVMLIGHTMRLVMALSDRVVVLDHGVMLSEGTTTEVQNDPKVVAAYLGAHEDA